MVLICRRHTWDISHQHGLGHHYSICEHLLPNHNLSQALTAKLSRVQLSRQVGSCRQWKYFMSTSSADAMYDVTTRFSPQFHMLIWVHWRSIADVPGTHWNRSQNVVSCNRRQVGGIWEPGLNMDKFWHASLCPWFIIRTFQRKCPRWNSGFMFFLFSRKSQSSP